VAGPWTPGSVELLITLLFSFSRHFKRVLVRINGQYVDTIWSESLTGSCDFLDGKLKS